MSEAGLFMVPYPLYPLPRNEEGRNLCGEGDNKKRGASAPLKRPASCSVVIARMLSEITHFLRHSVIPAKAGIQYSSQFSKTCPDAIGTIRSGMTVFGQPQGDRFNQTGRGVLPYFFLEMK
jgi:hypothetical protein